MKPIDLFEVLIIFSLGYIAMYLPSFQLAKSEKLSGKELSEKYPEHEWIRSSFLILYLLWILFFGIIFYNLSSQINIVYLMGWFFSSTGIFIGSFAFFTGVCYFPTRSPWLRFVVGDDARKAGRIQIIWSLGVIIITSGMALFGFGSL